VSNATPTTSGEVDPNTRLSNFLGSVLVEDELRRALAADSFVSEHAASQAKTLLKSGLRAEPSGDGFAVRTPTGQPVGEFVAAQLARPEYAHFLRSGTAHGGTAFPGQRPSAPAPFQPEPEPPVGRMTLGERMLMQAHQARVARQARQAAADPATDMALPYGLPGRRESLPFGR
jgi:hypothetical protein